MGTVSAEAAAATGLPVGLPVIGGAADHIVSALGAGIRQSGDILIKFGGAGDIVVATDKPLPDARLYLDYHLIPGLYAPNGCMASSGSALNWLAGLVATDAAGHRTHAELDQLAAGIPPGSDGLVCLPYFLGEKTPIHDPTARGSFVGLSLGHTRGHLWRAMLEAVAFGFRHHVDVLREIGHTPKRYVASDGGSRSRIWMQITADILGAPVTVLDNAHGSSVGAAFVGAIGTGLVTDWDEVTHLSKLGITVVPDPVASAAYEEGYRRYRSLYRHLAPYFQEAAGA
jgi:xylulokinase